LLLDLRISYHTPSPAAYPLANSELSDLHQIRLGIEQAAKREPCITLHGLENAMRYVGIGRVTRLTTDSAMCVSYLDMSKAARGTMTLHAAAMSPNTHPRTQLR